MARELLTRKEAADYLRVSRAFLDQKTAQGKITPVKMGRKVLYKQEHLQIIVDAGGLKN